MVSTTATIKEEEDDDEDEDEPEPLNPFNGGSVKSGGSSICGGKRDTSADNRKRGCERKRSAAESSDLASDGGRKGDLIESLSVSRQLENSSSQASAANYISSLVYKSSAFLNNIKQQYSAHISGPSGGKLLVMASSPASSSSPANSSSSSTSSPSTGVISGTERQHVQHIQQQQQFISTSPMKKRDISERQLSDSSFFCSSSSSSQAQSSLAPQKNSGTHLTQQTATKTIPNSKENYNNNNNNNNSGQGSIKPARPPLPTRELSSGTGGGGGQLRYTTSLALTQSLEVAGSNPLSQGGTNNDNNNSNNSNNKAVAGRSGGSMIAMRSLNSNQQNSTHFLTSNHPSPNHRRHAIREQSLERDAALSFKIQQQKEHKHKRTASIKSALRHAHLGHFTRSSEKSSSHHHHHHHHHHHQNKSSNSSANSGGSSEKDGGGGGGKDLDKVAKSMPYELFEPPITQRTFERSKRRDAMLSDPKRQLSADTIGLRQLTDEYLHNAGVKPMSSSGQCSLVALGGGGGGGSNNTTNISPNIPTTTTSDPSNSAIPAAAAGQQPACSIESQLYQVSRQRNILRNSYAISATSEDYQHSGIYRRQTNSSGSQESLSHVQVMPGALPWQSDVSIQCELIQAPPSQEPYETTGDILNTIALPFRGSTMQLAELSNNSSSLDGATGSGGGASNISATLKRGLSAVINPHHLTAPTAAALQAVGGNLKKSLSNTLDISLVAQAAGVGGYSGSITSHALHLHSQDSLPAYTSFHNEPDSMSVINQDLSSHQQRSMEDYQQQQQQEQENSSSGGGLMSQLANKLTRQSSKKFVVSKKGLHRALSFDCRGYKRLEAAAQQQNQTTNNSNHNHHHHHQHQQQPSSATKHLLSASSKLRPHNRSTLGLNSDSSPRPYLPQSASQVDFQLPLLPYHKMQEAIVSQRLLEPPKVGSSGQSGATSGGNSTSSSVVVTDQATPSSTTTAAATATATTTTTTTTTKTRQAVVDVDQLLCSQIPTDRSPAHLPADPSCIRRSYNSESARRRKESSPSSNQVASASASAGSESASEVRRSTAPRLILDIPTITTITPAISNNQSSATGAGRSPERSNEGVAYIYSKSSSSTRKTSGNGDSLEEDGEEVDANGYSNSGNNNLAKDVILCLPSPNIAIDSMNAFSTISSSPSFCLDLKTNTSSSGGPVKNDKTHPNQPGSSQMLLNANEVFSGSQNLIKRPSTFMVSDAMSQVARALNSTTTAAQNAAGSGEQKNVVLRNRRQAIVPPKLATDGSYSDGESQVVGKLVDLDNDDQNEQNQSDLAGEDQVRTRGGAIENDDEMRAHRRKRSGGAGASSSKSAVGSYAAISGNQSNLPTFHIESDQSQENKNETSQVIVVGQTSERPDSQMTNIDSIVSSGSSTNLSNSGTRRGDFTVTSPGGLTVSFNSSSRGRRRSSIAVIPQMQICPGDLLVYSKQLIDRMNQDESEIEPPPQFLTIDDSKKGKSNIWSSLKLCAQFDNRTMRARNELLCSLEDVLASLQPSTFVDEQLSHYKGMLWNEFLYETESRRSASSEALSMHDDEQQLEKKNYQDDVLELALNIDYNSHDNDNRKSDSSEMLAKEGTSGDPSGKFSPRESLKVSVSSGTGSGLQTSGPNQQHHRSRDPTVRSSLASRFREKPKLKRGQTVDSVFRIPLIPSSPLKHAQQHQQTPTAHLEDVLITIEDDERSSLSSFASGRESVIGSTNHARHNRSSSTRSRTGSAHGRPQRGDSPGKKQATSGENPSTSACNFVDETGSFDTDDGLDLVSNSASRPKAGYPQQIVRQSSLSTLSSTITRTEQKRQMALWDLFQSECTFFFDHLLTLKNVYMEPLKKIQVEGFAMFADPDVLFGTLDELCCGVYDFCKEFLYIIMRTLKTRPEELNATDVLIKLYKKNPKIDHLRGVYHRYTLNYINALTYLETLRKQVEFVEFEKWSSRDVRCKKLQLTDLLVAPVQHIMRVPIILKDIESHTENARDRDEIRAILAVEEASLRELDDKMRWLKNFERLLEIQKNISWPSVLELDVKLFVPEFLKEVLSKQPCERLIVSPRRQIVHEGTLSNLDVGKASDMHVILFDDMLLLTRRKKGLTKKASTVCKSNSGGISNKDDGSFKYIVYKQPLSLDRFYVHDVQQVDSQSIGLKHLFLLIVMNRFQQIINVHSFSAPNDDIKQTWLFKIKKTTERWKRNFSNPTTEQQGQLRTNLEATHVPVAPTPSYEPEQVIESRASEGQGSSTIPVNSKHGVSQSSEIRSSRQNLHKPGRLNNDQISPAKHHTHEDHGRSATIGINQMNRPQQDHENHHNIELIVTSASATGGSSHENSPYSDLTTTYAAH